MVMEQTNFVYHQIHGILTGTQTQLCLIGLHARHGLNLNLRICPGSIATRKSSAAILGDFCRLMCPLNCKTFEPSYTINIGVLCMPVIAYSLPHYRVFDAWNQ